MSYALNDISDTSPDQVANDAAQAPKTLIDASLGKLEGSNRPMGLILTKQQIIDLYLYEQRGLHLPTNAEDVSTYLGYDQQNPPGRGLAVSDFTKTFSIIKTHASQWNDLRQRVKRTTAELKIFAVSMTTTGARVTALLDDIEVLKTLKDLGIKTLEDLKRVEQQMGKKIPGVELSEEDVETAEGIGYYLDQVLRKIKAQEALTDQLKQDLDRFASELSITVRPEISLRLAAIDNNSFKDDVIRLQKEIEGLNKEIDEKNASYKQMVNDSLKAASGLNIIGLGMAIYIGVEAEKVRKERNVLKAARDKKNNEMGTKSTVLRRLNEVKADMQDIEFLTLQADVATKNLVTVWNTLHLYVKMSREESDIITDALKVRYLAGHFEQVVQPWTLILEEADGLHGVFAEADIDIKKYHSK